MANGPKTKEPEVEKAAATIFGKMPKEVVKRKWTPAAYGALIREIAVNCGAKFASEEGRLKFAELLRDSDLSFSSNWKKYATLRGWLPKDDEYTDVDYNK